jgi:hypothetical protein
MAGDPAGGGEFRRGSAPRVTQPNTSVLFLVLIGTGSAGRAVAAQCASVAAWENHEAEQVEGEKGRMNTHD